MSGKSDQEKAAQQQMYDIGDLQRNIKSGQYTVANPFTNYQNPYGFSQMEGRINDAYANTKDLINRSTAEAIAEGTGEVSSSLASRGITGGSAVDTAKSRIAGSVNKSKNDTLANLGIQNSKDLAGLMQYFNAMDLDTTKAASNVDFNNVQNVLGSLLRSYGVKGNNMQYLDNTTGWDDAMAATKLAIDAAQLIPGI